MKLIINGVCLSVIFSVAVRIISLITIAINWTINSYEDFIALVWKCNKWNLYSLNNYNFYYPTKIFPKMLSSRMRFNFNNESGHVQTTKLFIKMERRLKKVKIEKKTPQSKVDQVLHNLKFYCRLLQLWFFETFSAQKLSWN